MGGALSKYDRETKKVTVFPVPTINAIVYGVVADRNDNIWMALWDSGNIAKFDTHTNAWTIFPPPTYPGHVRRLNVDAQNNIWFGIYSAGKRPGKLVKLDQTTGKMTEVHDPPSERESLRRRSGSRGQHLEPRRRRQRRGDLEVQSEGLVVHVVSEATDDRGHAEDPDYEGRGGLVFAAGKP